MASSVNLGPQLETYVTELVKNGRYNSRSEVLREGIRLVEEREKRLAVLNAAISRGLADADSGQTTPFDNIEQDLVARYTRMVEERGL